MQHEHEERGSAPSSADIARTRTVGPTFPVAAGAESRPSTASETVPSEQLWRAAIRAARDAAALAADLRRQLTAAMPPGASG